MNWEMYGVAIAGLTVIYWMNRNAKSDINARFDKVDHDLNDIKEDISDIKDRMSFLEAANIYTMPLEPAQPNPRSQAAKEMWARRRQKKLEKKDG